MITHLSNPGALLTAKINTLGLLLSQAQSRASGVEKIARSGQACEVVWHGPQGHPFHSLHALVVKVQIGEERAAKALAWEGYSA